MLDVQKTSLAWLIMLTQRTHSNPPGIEVARTSFRKVENRKPRDEILEEERGRERKEEEEEESGYLPGAED